MLTVFNQILTLAVIIVIGIILAKLSILDNQTRKKLSSMLVYVIAPLYVIVSFQIDFSTEILKTMGIIAIFAFIIMSVGLLVGKLLWRNMEKEKSRILTHASGFMNCGYMGYPVLYALFGSIGVLYAAVFVMVFQLFLWTIGVMIFSEKPKTLYEPLLKPGIIGVAIGIVLFIFKIELPSFLFNAFSMVGKMTPPIAMLIIGAFLSEVDILHSLKDFPTYAVAFFRLIVAPAIALAILLLFGFTPDDGIFFSCIVILSGMPTGTNNVLFATNYDSNPKYAASVVAISTILSGITIPLWIMIIDMI